MNFRPGIFHVTSYFIAAVNWLLGPDIEGEHSNDAADKGGDTWYGLARRWNQDMPWPPTRDQAIARYRERYWDACRCDELPVPWLCWCLMSLCSTRPARRDPLSAAHRWQRR
jgi:hypothetical protein